MRSLDDFAMVESQRGEFVNRKPGRIDGVRPGFQSLGVWHEGVVGYRDHPASRVAITGPKCVQLFQENIVDSGLFLQFPNCSFVYRFGGEDKSPRKRKFALIWRGQPTNEQEVQFSLQDGEKDNVDCISR